MMTDDREVQQLALRSNLPRLAKEGFHLFAALDADEQKLAVHDRIVAIVSAFVALVAREEARSDRPLPPVVPRAYTVTRSDDDWIALTFYGDLENPFERRRRDGTVLGIAKHVEARIRVYKGAFAYFAGDDIRGVDAIDPGAATPL